MRTLSQAPWRPALRFRAATPRSLAALVLDLPTASLVVSRASTMSSIIEKGDTVACFKAFCMASRRAAFSSSVSFGRSKTADTTLKASVSLSMASSNWSWRWALFSWTPLMWSSNSAYFFLPMVSSQIIFVSEIPFAADRAAAEPPPGAGASEPRTLANSVILKSTSFIELPF